jgi:SpoVK/Ycf46/Vps4 family AAA+-type ATPase
LQLSYNKEYLIEAEIECEVVNRADDDNIHSKKRKLTIDVNEGKQNEDILNTSGDTNIKIMNNSNEGRGLVVIAATNRLEDLDEAIVRRFESKVLVNVPDLQERLALVSNYMRGIDINLNEAEESAIGEMTFGWSGSEIEALCRDASFGPIRDMMPILAARTNSDTNPNNFAMRSVTNDDFLRSYNSLMGNNLTNQTT